MIPAGTAVSTLPGAGLIAMRLYYLEEAATVLLILVIPFAAFILLCFGWYLLREAGKGAIRLVRQFRQETLGARHQQLPQPASAAVLNSRR